MSSGAGLPPRTRQSRPKVEKEPARKMPAPLPRESTRPAYRGGSKAAGASLTVGGVILALFFIGFKLVKRNDDAKDYIASFFGSTQAAPSEPGAASSPNTTVAPPTQNAPPIPTVTGGIPGTPSSTPTNGLPTSLPPNVKRARSIPAGVATAEYFRTVKVDAVPIPNRAADNLFIHDLQLVFKRMVQISQDIVSNPNGSNYFLQIGEVRANLNWALRQAYLREPISISEVQGLADLEQFKPSASELAALNRFDEVFKQGKVADIYAWPAVNDFNKAMDAILPMAGAAFSRYQPANETPHFIATHVLNLRDQCRELADLMDKQNYDDARQLIGKADEDFIYFKIDYLKHLRTGHGVIPQAIAKRLKLYYSYMGHEAGEIDKNLELKREMVNATVDLKSGIGLVGNSDLENTRGRPDFDQRDEKFKTLYEEMTKQTPMAQTSPTGRSSAAVRPFERVEFTRSIGVDNRIGLRFAESFA